MFGCDSFGDGKPDPVTEIVNVIVEPNPVVVGDTTIFTCVIRDSIKAEVVYDWNLHGKDDIVHTNVNHVQWVAPFDTGKYRHAVEVRPLDPSDDTLWHAHLK